jgi:hypothetical protein
MPNGLEVANTVWEGPPNGFAALVRFEVGDLKLGSCTLFVETLVSVLTEAKDPNTDAAGAPNVGREASKFANDLASSAESCSASCSDT